MLFNQWPELELCHNEENNGTAPIAYKCLWKWLLFEGYYLSINKW